MTQTLNFESIGSESLRVEDKVKNEELALVDYVGTFYASTI